MMERQVFAAVNNNIFGAWQIALAASTHGVEYSVRRYFMTASEAGQLVLLALALGNGGKIFVLDMGDPVKIMDLARNLIRLSGLQRQQDSMIEFSGVGRGEKLSEELSLQAEHPAPTRHPRIGSFRLAAPLGEARIKARRASFDGPVRAAMQPV
jgi:FlaA1/EpsC-like NDP-sugar epimerase